MANRNSATPGGDKPRLTEEEKKLNHIRSEKKRREAIRDGFNRLSDIVPGMEGKGRSEALVLEATKTEIQRQLAIMEMIKAKAVSDGLATPTQFNAHYDPKNQPADFIKDAPDRPLQLDRNGLLTQATGRGQSTNGMYAGMQPPMQFGGGLVRAQPPMPARRSSSRRSSAGSATMAPPAAPASRPTSRDSNASNLPAPAHLSSRPSSRGSNDGTPTSQRPGSSGSNGLPTTFSQPMMQPGITQPMLQFPNAQHQPILQYGGYTWSMMPPPGMQQPPSPYGNMQYPNMFQLGSMQPGMQPYGMAPPAQMHNAGSFNDGQQGHSGYETQTQTPSQHPASQNGNQNIKPEATGGSRGTVSSHTSSPHTPAEAVQRQERLNVIPPTEAQWRKIDAQMKAEKDGDSGS